jgi:hypothetical protein
VEEYEEDLIFIRGNIEIVTARDERAMASSPLMRKLSKETDPLVCVESASPFYFISKLGVASIRVKEPSLFLSGHLDYDIFEL